MLTLRQWAPHAYKHPFGKRLTALLFRFTGSPGKQKQNQNI